MTPNWSLGTDTQQDAAARPMLCAWQLERYAVL